MNPQPFSWTSFDRTARALQSLGYLVAVFGPLAGLGMIVFGDTVIRLAGVAVLLASFLIALYHISFSLLMSALRDLAKGKDTEKTP